MYNKFNEIGIDDPVVQEDIIRINNRVLELNDFVSNNNKEYERLKVIGEDIIKRLAEKEAIYQQVQKADEGLQRAIAFGENKNDWSSFKKKGDARNELALKYNKLSVKLDKEISEHSIAVDKLNDSIQSIEEEFSQIRAEREVIKKKYNIS